ncbi:hybrid sensor histidine kinase/response regulator [Granulosicoccus antarcticus]|uniref:histidine kinase n=1 Tax=Granulosicoccus antarcticus IMCC3135 TaxID=1192854 RepID=A0A2Z2NYB9_9GAMM|nr:hybrid sensor histidine kinase/response regulator [Granulosicoccus antarcticus]ASJ76303.1 Sensor histidine kinase TodS [Granulosicoccus antarcticus IMCC3135]
MKGKYWLFVLITALLMCVAVLFLVMTRLNEARTNLALSGPIAYNYLLQTDHNLNSFVDTLQDFRTIKDDVEKEEESRSLYRKRFDVVWAGFSIFDINFRIQSVQQDQVTEFIEYATDYLTRNEHLMAADYHLSDTQVAELIVGARSISQKLVTIGHQYFIHAGHLSDLWRGKIHRLYYFFWFSVVLLLLTGTLLTTMLLRSNKRSAELVEKSFKTQREMKSLIEELRSGKLESKAKDSFIAAASHDLRQPLHALGLFLGATEKHIVSETGQKALNEAKHCAAELNKLFNSLLDLSRLDAGVVEIDKVDFKLDRLLGVVDQEYSARARHSEISLSVCSTLENVHSDALLLNRILRNLLENSFTHSGASEIKIACESKAQIVRLTLSDNGCGIPASEQAHVFSEYYQLGNPERDRSKGLGLGLSIVKRLCELLDVDISLESSAGNGTQFHLDIPMGAAYSAIENDSVALSDNRIHSPTGTLVAVIDDDSSICRGMVSVLESMHFEVVAAESAELLIEECKSSVLTPDILLVDYRLRDNQTGDAAIHCVRSALGMDFPAIIITGDTSPARMNNAAQSGFELLHKPVEPADLVERIRALLASKEHPSSATG